MTDSIYLEGNPGNGWQFAGACKTVDEAQAALKLRQEQYPQCEWRIVYPTESARMLHIDPASAPDLYAALEAALPVALDAEEQWSNGEDCYSSVVTIIRAALAKARGMKGGE